MANFESNPIVNIVRAEVLTLEESPRLMAFESLSSASPEPCISDGGEKELRIKNRILAQDMLEDIIKGYNIKLKDCVLSRDLLEIIDGGAVREAGADRYSGYSAPAGGAPSERTRFVLRLYTAEKDYSGEAKAYFRFTFPHCVGTPAKFSFEDGVFSTPEYLVRSRTASGQSAMLIECIDRLPVLCAEETEIPPSFDEGNCFVVTAPMVIGGDEYNVGDTVSCTGAEYRKMLAD